MAGQLLMGKPAGNRKYFAAYSSVDAQVTYRIPTAKASIKIGGADIFNHRYLQYAGGPTIGALYYVAFTFEGLFNK